MLSFTSELQQSTPVTVTASSPTPSEDTIVGNRTTLKNSTPTTTRIIFIRQINKGEAPISNLSTDQITKALEFALGLRSMVFLGSTVMEPLLTSISRKRHGCSSPGNRKYCWDIEQHREFVALEHKQAAFLKE
ncbi:hypothetical protein BsWGS_10198 [Bradybaena similaris]